MSCHRICQHLWSAAALEKLSFINQTDSPKSIWRTGSVWRDSQFLGVLANCCGRRIATAANDTSGTPNKCDKLWRYRWNAAEAALGLNDALAEREQTILHHWPQFARRTVTPHVIVIEEHQRAASCRHPTHLSRLAEHDARTNHRRLIKCFTTDSNRFFFSYLSSRQRCWEPGQRLAKPTSRPRRPNRIRTSTQFH